MFSYVYDIGEHGYNLSFLRLRHLNNEIFFGKLPIFLWRGSLTSPSTHAVCRDRP